MKFILLTLLQLELHYQYAMVNGTQTPMLREWVSVMRIVKVGVCRQCSE